MTYYEELGLSPSASTDQIRHSYKTLVRLLHPDQCHDESLKYLAELQMRRLNQVLAVLTDPVERRHYDARLMTPPKPVRRHADHFVSPMPPKHQWLRRALVGLCAWGTPAAAFVACMALLLYYGSGVRPALTSSAPPDSGDDFAPPPVALAAAGFAGHWSYLRAARPLPSMEIDLPESVELHITESAGLLSGRYDARYRGADQTIEPDVAFQFEGFGGVPAAQLPWTGPGESKGKLTLRLLSPDQIEVTWFATQSSAELNLGSGSAQLIRQREPRN